MGVDVIGDIFRLQQRRDRFGLDGRLDEPFWERARAATGFEQRQPDPGSAATERTEVRILFDDEDDSDRPEQPRG